MEINFSNLQVPSTVLGVVGIIALAFLLGMVAWTLQQIRLTWTSWVERKMKKQEQGVKELTEEGQKVDNGLALTTAAQVREMHKVIADFLDVRDKVIESSTMIHEVKTTLDLMQQNIQEIFQLVRGHEAQLARLEGVEEGRRKG